MKIKNTFFLLISLVSICSGSQETEKDKFLKTNAEIAKLNENSDAKNKTVPEFKEKNESTFKKRAKAYGWIAGGIGCLVTSLLLWHWPSSAEAVADSKKVKIGLSIVEWIKGRGWFEKDLKDISNENKDKLLGTIRLSFRGLSLINGLFSTFCLYKGIKSLHRSYTYDSGDNYENY